MSNTSSTSQRSQVSPAMIVVAVIVLAVIVYAIYHFTLGAAPTLNTNSIPSYMKGRIPGASTAGAPASAVNGPQGAPYGPQHHPGQSGPGRR